jgi:hypothetical protein
MSSLPLFFARVETCGAKRATTVVLFIAAETALLTNMITPLRRRSPRPPSLRIQLATTSNTPVCCNAPPSTKIEPRITRASLPNPAKASTGVRIPVAMRTETRRRVTTSTETASDTNKTIAIARRIKQTTISQFMVSWFQKMRKKELDAICRTAKKIARRPALGGRPAGIFGGGSPRATLCLYRLSEPIARYRSRE